MNYCKARKELFCCLICPYYVFIICYYLGITLVCVLNFCSISLPLIPHLHKNVTFYSPQQSLAVLFFHNYVSTSYFFSYLFTMATFEVGVLVGDWPVKQSRDDVSLKKPVLASLFLSERQRQLQGISCSATMVSPALGLCNYRVLHL